jgi:hypothetical protein
VQAPDRHGRPAAACVRPGGSVTVQNTEPYVFGPAQSFTIQAWFQTGSPENQVIAARQGAYSLGVKEGRLSAWIMQDGGQFVEAGGTAPAADGQWHHAAAVYDRDAQTLALYLDGRPDGATPSIAEIGASSSPAPLMLGSFGGSFPFDGSLDEISIHRATLDPGDFSFAEEYAAVRQQPLGALTGRYTTTQCDWGQRVQNRRVTIDAIPNDGEVSALVETSNDSFVTVSEMQQVALMAGKDTYDLSLPVPASQVRITLDLTTTDGAQLSPRITALQLFAEPTD